MRYGIVAVVVFAVIAWGAWKFQRSWNYSWAYENFVRGTICEMVKPEYLKNPQQCK